MYSRLVKKNGGREKRSKNKVFCETWPKGEIPPGTLHLWSGISKWGTNQGNLSSKSDLFGATLDTCTQKQLLSFFNITHTVLTTTVNIMLWPVFFTVGLYFHQHEQLHHSLETLPVRGATKSHKFKLLPLFVWTVLRHNYSKNVTATLLEGVLERVFHKSKSKKRVSKHVGHDGNGSLACLGVWP